MKTLLRWAVLRCFAAWPKAHDQREHTKRHRWREGTRYDQSKARPGWTAYKDEADAQVPA
ncbi:hypothetical protein [Nocardia sp. NPDC050710]|uniref:hypothetical protein n=1 Tax=Nocardia sp. NPDC050710 TaxID=3157220 RepID=UPI0033C7ECFE